MRFSEGHYGDFIYLIVNLQIATTNLDNMLIYEIIEYMCLKITRN